MYEVLIACCDNKEQRERFLNDLEWQYRWPALIKMGDESTAKGFSDIFEKICRRIQNAPVFEIISSIENILVNICNPLTFTVIIAPLNPFIEPIDFESWSPAIGFWR